MITDPVCNMQLNEQEVMDTRTFEGEAYYFCSEACRAEFERHMEDYVRKVQPERERETDVQISLLHR